MEDRSVKAESTPDATILNSFGKKHGEVEGKPIVGEDGTQGGKPEVNRIPMGSKV